MDIIREYHEAIKTLLMNFHCGTRGLLPSSYAMASIGELKKTIPCPEEGQLPILDALSKLVEENG